jgi:hypothetical protein
MGPGGGLSTGPGGGLSAGPGGGLSTGPQPYMSNQPPPAVLVKHLAENGMLHHVEYWSSPALVDT